MIGTESSIRAAVLGALPDVGKLRSAAPVGKGFSSEAWLVDGEAGPLLAKIALRDPGGRRVTNAATAVRQAREHGVATPRCLHVTAAHADFGGRAFSVSEFLPGQDGEHALRTMEVGARSRFFSDWGAAVGRLHGAERAAFADDTLGTGQRSTWTEVIAAKLAAVPARYAKAGIEYDGAAAEAVARIRAGGREVSDAVRPTIVHHDLYLANTLVSDQRCAGLLDFEYARVWDPASDFVKPTLFAFDAFPEARAAFLAGYEQVRALPDPMAARLSVALGLELVSSIPLFHGWGDTEALVLYRRALDRWLDSSPPHQGGA